MPKTNSPESRGTRLLRLFQKLMFEGRRHYQSDLAEHLECSAQTVARLIEDIEETVGTGLEIGTDNRRRYYRLKSLASRRTLGLDFEELRYLTICHDLASPHLPQQISERVEKTIFEISTLMADLYSRNIRLKHTVTRITIDDSRNGYASLKFEQASQPPLS